MYTITAWETRGRRRPPCGATRPTWRRCGASSGTRSPRAARPGVWTPHRLNGLWVRCLELRRDGAGRGRAGAPPGTSFPRRPPTGSRRPTSVSGCAGAVGPAAPRGAPPQQRRRPAPGAQRPRAPPAASCRPPRAPCGAGRRRPRSPAPARRPARCHSQTEHGALEEDVLGAGGRERAEVVAAHQQRGGRARAPPASSGRGVVEHPPAAQGRRGPGQDAGTRSGGRRRRGARRSRRRRRPPRARRGRPAAGPAAPAGCAPAGRSLAGGDARHLAGGVDAGVGAPGHRDLHGLAQQRGEGRRGACPRRCAARAGRPSPRSPRRRTPGRGGGPAGTGLTGRRGPRRPWRAPGAPSAPRHPGAGRASGRGCSRPGRR